MKKHTKCTTYNWLAIFWLIMISFENASLLEMSCSISSKGSRSTEAWCPQLISVGLVICHIAGLKPGRGKSESPARPSPTWNSPHFLESLPSPPTEVGFLDQLLLRDTSFPSYGVQYLCHKGPWAKWQETSRICPSRKYSSAECSWKRVEKKQVFKTGIYQEWHGYNCLFSR